jgi:hypothetical protein
VPGLCIEKALPVTLAMVILNKFPTLVEQRAIFQRVLALAGFTSQSWAVFDVNSSPL